MMSTKSSLTLRLTGSLLLAACFSFALAAPKKSLYQRLGGVLKIAAIADDLVGKALMDPTLASNSMIMGRVQERHLTPAGIKYSFTEFICAKTGGPQKYT